ncbi:MAG: ATP-binding protein [Deltaproteobacteria bacterium]|jgi:hypothetical protein|nr:ATP-binding protein [Deltaproteobacteria bacterium]
MLNKNKLIPVEVYTFREMIEKGFVYADKTDLLHRLITNENLKKSFFLSRPRRFGKTMLLDTVAEIFNGDKEIFKDLKICQTDYDFKKHPVIRFNMNLPSRTPKQLEKELVECLKSLADLEKLNLRINSYVTGLSDLIHAVCDKYQEKVVILIDEYDDPVSSKLNKLDLAEEISSVLRTFYSGFKTCGPMLRFAFVTGVTRYALMGISTGFNQLTDITLDPSYATICGFTLDEMDLYFSERYPRILKILKEKGYISTKLWSTYAPSESEESLDYEDFHEQAVRPESDLITVEDLKNEILNWYDGYSWDGKNYVLNPISILKFFEEADFARYWSKTSASKNIIIKLLEKIPFEFTEDKLKFVPLDDISAEDVGDHKPIPLFFQTGYLTVDKITKKDGELYYSFKVPNLEIKKQYYGMLNNALFQKLSGDSDGFQLIKELKKSLFKKDGKALSGILSAYFAGLPPVLQSKYSDPGLISLGSKLNYNEHFFHQLLWSLFWAVTQKTRAEEPGALGTPDLVVPLNKTTIIVIEIKYSKTADEEDLDKDLNKLATKALEVIKKKKYGESYKLPWNNVITIGVGVCGRGDVLALFGESD